MTPGARSADAILQATLDLLAERGFDGLSVDAVAARAGVGKATIYRHWGSRARLVYDAAHCLHDEMEEPDTGSLRGDLTVMLHGLVDFLGVQQAGRVLPTLIDAAERDAEFAALREEHVRSRRALAQRVFARAVARGELPAEVDIDQAVDLYAGPPFYRRLMTRTPMCPEEVAPHVELVLRAIGAETRADA